MVLEFLISTSKLLIIFICLGLFILSLIFKVMSGGAYYYYERDFDFVNMLTAYKDSVSLSKKFDPVFKNVKVIPLNDKVLVTSSFSKNSNFKKMFSDGKFNYGVLKK